jgi:hypothetical protein
MKIPVDEKNSRLMSCSIGDILLVGEKIERATPVSIYKACFMNARAM